MGTCSVSAKGEWTGFLKGSECPEAGCHNSLTIIGWLGPPKVLDMYRHAV